MRVDPPFPSGVVLIFERNRVSMGRNQSTWGTHGYQTHCYRYGCTLLLPDHTISPAVKNAIAAVAPVA